MATPQAIVNDTIQRLSFGTGQQFENLTVIPILGRVGGDAAAGSAPCSS